MRKLNDINTSSNQSLELMNGVCYNGKVAHACRCLHATRACQNLQQPYGSSLKQSAWLSAATP